MPSPASARRHASASLLILLALTACAEIPSEPTPRLARAGGAASLTQGTSTTGVPYTAIGSYLEVFGMSDAGHIVGGHITADGQHRGYVWHDGNLTTLPTLGGGDSQALDVNSRGDVVGRSQSETGSALATLWRSAQPTSLGALGGSHSEARAINDAGTVVGFSSRSGRGLAPFVWANGVMSELPTPAGNGGGASDINEKGWIVGAAWTADFSFMRAVIWKDGVMAEIPSFGGFFSEAVGINENGDVVGYSMTPQGEMRAFVWTGGATITDIGLPGSTLSIAEAINDAGVVVGRAHVGTSRAFMWANGELKDLGTAGSDPNAAAWDVNNLGQIAGNIGNFSGYWALTPPKPQDVTPPVIAYELSPATPESGWHTTDVALAWSVSDAESDITSSGCGAQSVTADTQGASFTCSAVSEGGSDAKTVTIKRDATNPVITFAGAGTFTVDRTISVSCTASDATSGIATSVCPTLSGDAFTMALGTQTLNASATDNVGNSATASAQVTIVVDNASLQVVTARCVTDKGILNSLQAKLRAGSINAYLNELRAQSGKKISEDCADNLSRLARALLNA